MQNVTCVKLARDCEAVQIPSGAAVVLPADTVVDITQTLGGAYTVHAPGGLYRIAAKDADALRIEAPGPDSSTDPTHARPGATPCAVNEKTVWDALKTCYDPEIPVNIVDLGLVYDMRIERLSEGYNKVFVKMTLTAPGCGMGTAIAGDAQEKLLCLPGIEEAVVELVWDPPWHQSMISADGRRILGLE